MIIQFFGSGGLEPAAPRTAQTEIAEAEHCRYFRRQAQAELLVAGQAQARSDVDSLRRTVLVLHVSGRGIVAHLAVVHPHGRLQIVVAPLSPGTQPVASRQGEHSFHRCHGAPLVALHLLLSGEIGHIVPDRAVYNTVCQRHGGKIMIVRMSVPVYIKPDEIIAPEFKFSSRSQRAVVILKIVSLHVARRILAARAVDALPVYRPVGIQFELRRRVPRQPLGNLPIGVPVHGLVSRVGDEELGLRRVFDRRVLPSVAVLKLEIGVRAHLAKPHGEAVVLPDVSVAAGSGGVLYQQSAVVPACDYIYHARYRVAAI